MISAWIPAVFYLVATATAVFTARSLPGYLIAPRVLLAIALGTWAWYYLTVDQLDPAVSRSLARVLHLPTAVAFIIPMVAHWCMARKQRRDA